VRELPTIALTRIKGCIKRCAEIGPGTADHGGACAIPVARRKVNAQHVGALRSESFQVLGPLNQGYAALLSLINHSSTQGITPHGESICIYMPDGQITVMLRNQNERWRGQLGFCMQRDSDGAGERCLSSPEVAREKHPIAWTE
jgi:hypothetical protein